MNETYPKEVRSDARRPIFRTRAGVTYFSRETERRFFFVATMVMLVVGILSKLGWF